MLNSLQEKLRIKFQCLNRNPLRPKKEAILMAYKDNISTKMKRSQKGDNHPRQEDRSGKANH